jgi:K+-transporting ATPase KdpF subunit
MSLLNWVSLVLVIAVAAYLVWALLRAEDL